MQRESRAHQDELLANEGRRRRRVHDELDGVGGAVDVDATVGVGVCLPEAQRRPVALRSFHAIAAQRLCGANLNDLARGARGEEEEGEQRGQRAPRRHLRANDRAQDGK